MRGMPRPRPPSGNVLHCELCGIDLIYVDNRPHPRWATAPLGTTVVAEGENRLIDCGQCGQRHLLALEVRVKAVP